MIREMGNVELFELCETIHPKEEKESTTTKRTEQFSSSHSRSTEATSATWERVEYIGARHNPTETLAAPCHGTLVVWVRPHVRGRTLLRFPVFFQYVMFSDILNGPLCRWITGVVGSQL